MTDKLYTQKEVDDIQRLAQAAALRAHNYFYREPSGMDSESHEPGYYYCLCGWEGPDRGSYWTHISDQPLLAEFETRLRAEAAAVMEKLIAGWRSENETIGIKQQVNGKIRGYSKEADELESLILTDYASALDRRVAEARLTILQEACEIECDYCGGRAFESTGKEIPFQVPNDRNWYHRVVSPCKAAPIQHVLAELRRAADVAGKEKSNA